ADETVIPAIVVVQAKGMQPRRALVRAGQRAQRLAFDLRLDTAAAERAGLGAIRKNQHGGPGFLRRGAACFHDGAVNTGPPSIEGVGQLSKQVEHGAILPIFGFGTCHNPGNLMKYRRFRSVSLNSYSGRTVMSRATSSATSVSPQQQQGMGMHV